MYFQAPDVANSNFGRISLRCPHCRSQGTFEPMNECRDLQGQFGPNQPGGAGLRRCPHPNCFGLVLVFRNDQGHLIASLPPEIVDFDPSEIPPEVQASFEEALTCHAYECYRAAALMVRRTLEEICREREVDGGNLAERLEALSQKLAVPKELFDAAHALRLLGNDAAHIDARTYDQVGRDEIKLALDLAKEIMKATYQYAALLGRLQDLQRDNS